MPAGRGLLVGALLLLTAGACEPPPDACPGGDCGARSVADTQIGTEPVTPVPPPPALDLQRVRLGRALFSDPAVSKDGKVSCASCHAPPSGTVPLPSTALPDREHGPINVPTVLNVGLQRRLAWTGKFSTLEDMAGAAMKAKHAMATTWTEARAGLAASPERVAAFAAAYPDGLTDGNVCDALVTYLRSLVTYGAPFDRFLAGETAAIPEEARHGWELFTEYGCVSCHQGVNVGGNMFQKFGVMDDPMEGRPLTPADDGRYNVTHRDEDRHVFRVPSLRNVELTAPYFHDGSAATLEEAVQVMARVQVGRPLRVPEVRAIAAFLRSLTGRDPWN